LVQIKSPRRIDIFVVVIADMVKGIDLVKDIFAVINAGIVKKNVLV
jgi:hypothetical protein